MQQILLKAQRRTTSDPNMSQYSAKRLANFVKSIIVLLAVGIILLPVALLFLNQMSKPEMFTIVLASVLVFSGTFSFVMKAKEQEVFISTAA
jgi:hypothetical protein